MALTEEQILRYSRQILLKEVGGIGQERLLAAKVWMSPGSGAALRTARAYLEAGGSQVDSSPDSPEASGSAVAGLDPRRASGGIAESSATDRMDRNVSGGESGRASGGPAEAGAPHRMDRSGSGGEPGLAQGKPGEAAGDGDGELGPEPRLAVVQAGEPLPESGAVAIVAAEGVAFGGGGACRACLERTVQGLTPPSAVAELQGALAALVLQRALLLGEDEGFVSVPGLERRALAKCGRCA